VIIFEDTPCENVGIVNSEFSIPFILSDDIAETMVVAQLFESGSEKLLFYTDDIDSTVSQLTELGYEAEDAYNVARAEYVAELRSEVAGRITSILVTLGGIIVYVFLMTRSSMLGRIKEIGIYRSIGATKNDIYKIFLAEILALTTIGSLTGYLLMTYIVNRIEQALSGVMSIFHLTIPLFLAGIVGIYAINIVFGMLPIFTLLRKTPSEINAKYDI
jgi:ABC-type antimicrobial peptide transport system permease subunit